MKSFLTLLCVLFGIVSFGQQVKKHLTPEEQIERYDSIKKSMVGKPYPDFKYKGDDGKMYSKKALLGKAYYINFWFEGCHPCMEEMDSLNALNNKLKNTKNEFISFTFEKLKDIARIRKERKLNFKIISVSDEECRRLNLGNGFPTHIVVDKNGNIAYVGLMMTPNEQALKDVYTLLKN
jgi:peroxiredoxin